MRVVQAYENRDGAMRQLAITFRVSVSCDAGSSNTTGNRQCGAEAHGGGAPAKVNLSGLAVVQALVQAAPDATLRELCQPCAGQHRFPSAVPP